VEQLEDLKSNFFREIAVDDCDHVRRAALSGALEDAERVRIGADRLRTDTLCAQSDGVVFKRGVLADNKRRRYGAHSPSRGDVNSMGSHSLELRARVRTAGVVTVSGVAFRASSRRPAQDTLSAHSGFRRAPEQADRILHDPFPCNVLLCISRTSSATAL